MRKIIGTIIMVFLLLLPCASCSSGPPSTRIFDVHKGTETSFPQIINDLKKAKVIVVGEFHNNPNHHVAQLEVIKALRQSGIPVAIGLEMFRRASQESLNRWIRGQLSEEEFQKIYYRNWNVPWPLYRAIFVYARDNHIPLVGLNIPEDITNQVAKKGFSSLTPEQKASLPNVTCRVGPAYEEFVKRAHEGHYHSGMNFGNFCEAQLLWDASMAVNALSYLKSNPQATLVILAGTGHTWKEGIPNQISKRSGLPVRVILPQAPGETVTSITAAEADYLWLGL